MPEVNAYTFNHKELLELLIKAAGVHEGEWMLQVNFGFSAANIGQDEESVHPAAIATVNYVGIAKAKQDSPRSLVLDAAKVNPASST